MHDVLLGFWAGKVTICVPMPMWFTVLGCEQNSLTIPILGHSPSDYIFLHLNHQYKDNTEIISMIFEDIFLNSSISKIIKCNLTFSTRRDVTTWSTNMVLISFNI